MSETCNPEAGTKQRILEAELNLRRLLESRDQAPAEEKPVLEQRIRSVETEIERLKAGLPA